jgi:hypothetical protein
MGSLVGASLGLIGGVVGSLIQRKQGKDMINQGNEYMAKYENRQKYDVPSVIKKGLNFARMDAYADSTLARNMTEMADREAANNVSNIKRMGGSSASVNAKLQELEEKKAGGYKEAAVAGYQDTVGKKATLAGERHLAGEFEDKKYDYNVMQPAIMNASFGQSLLGAGQQMKNAGTQGLFRAITSASSMIPESFDKKVGGWLGF